MAGDCIQQCDKMETCIGITDVDRIPNKLDCDRYMKYQHSVETFMHTESQIYLKDCRRVLCWNMCHCSDNLYNFPFNTSSCTEGEEILSDILREFSNEEKTTIISTGIEELLTPDLLNTYLSVDREEVNVLILQGVVNRGLFLYAFSGMYKLRYLNLNNNDLTRINYDLFRVLFRLEALLLNNCNIHHININAFRNLKRLKYLDLSNNYFMMERSDDGSFTPTFNDNFSGRYEEMPEQKKYIFRSLESLETLRMSTIYVTPVIEKALFRGLQKLLYLTLGGKITNTTDLKSYHLNADIFDHLKNLKSVEFPPFHADVRFETPPSEMCMEKNCFKDCDDIAFYENTNSPVIYNYYISLAELMSENQLERVSAIHAQTVTFSATTDASLRSFESKLSTRDVPLRILTSELIINSTESARFPSLIHNSWKINPIRTQNNTIIFYISFSSYDTMKRELKLEVLTERYFIKLGMEGNTLIHGSYQNHIMNITDLGIDYLNIIYGTADYLTSLVKCAELLSYSVKKTPIGISILDSAFNLYWNTNSNDLFGAMMMRRRLKKQQDRTDEHFVPLLSLDIYRESLFSVSDRAEYYERKYDQLDARKLQQSDSKNVYSTLEEMTHRSIANSEKEVDNCKLRIKKNEQSIKAYRREFEKYKNELKQMIPEVQDSIEMEIDNHNTATSFFGAGAGLFSMIIGAMVNPFSAVLSVASFASEISGSALELSSETKNFMDAQKMIDQAGNACNDIVKMIDSGKMDIAAAETYLTDVYKTAELNVRKIVFTILPQKIRTEFEKASMGDLQNNDLYWNFILALENYGKFGHALATETIAQGNLVLDLSERAGMYNARRKQQTILRRMRIQYEQEEINSDIYLKHMKNALFETKVDLVEVLAQYCQAYLHYYMHDCDEKIKPDVSDSIDNLIRKAKYAKSMTHQDLGLRMEQSPQPFEIIYHVRDRDDCLNNTCPIAAFTRQPKNSENNKHVLFLTIHQNDSHFRAYDRVRVEEMDVELIGVTNNDVRNGHNNYILTIRSSPIFSDRIGDRTITFVGVSRSMLFIRSMDQGECV